MTPQQSRAARAVLGLKVIEAAAAIHGSVTTVVAFEKGRDVRLSSIKRLQELYESQGVRFTENGQGIVWPCADRASLTV